MLGIFLLWFLLLFSILSENDSIDHVPQFVYFLILVVELILTYFLSVNESNRYIGTLGEPNATAAFIIFLWPFYFFSTKVNDHRNNLRNIIVFFFVGLMLFLTNSRSAMVAFVIQLVFIILRKIKISLNIATAVGISLYLVSYFLPFFDNPIYENRTQIWQSALLANGNNILLGHGFGNMEKPLHVSAQSLGLLIGNSSFDSAHNIFLDWWVQGGITGIIILLTLVYISFKAFIKNNNERGLVLFLGMVTVLSFNPASIAGLLSFWWLIGQALKKI